MKQKRILRKAEKYYLQHPSPTSLAYYNNLKNIHRKSISTAKASHITHKFYKLSNDSKSIHRLSAQLLGCSLKSPLPTVTPEELPLLFDKSFNDKLSTTLSTLPTLILCLHPTTDPSLTSQSTLRSLNVLYPPNLSHTLQPIKSPTSSKTNLPDKSTESALILITSDLLSGLNNNRGTILFLLDVSFAFNTLDHNVLIQRLSAIGIT